MKNISEYLLFEDVILANEVLPILNLGERYKIVLEKRFKEKLTLTAIASEQQVSRERVRQLYEKAIFHIKSRIQVLIHEYQHLNTTHIRIQELEAENASLKKKIEYYQSIIPAPEVDILELDLQSTSLSIRAKNALRSAQIKSMKDLIRLNKSDLYGLKNIGLRTVQELAFYVASCGLKLKE